MSSPDKEQRPYSRGTSDLQRQLNTEAYLEHLEEAGIHTDSLMKQEDPTLGKIIFTRAIRRLHRKLTSRRRKTSL